jgi:amino acid transporter
MSGFISWLQSFIPTFGIIGNTILIIMAAVCIIFTLGKAMNELRQKKFGPAGGWFVATLAIIFVAIMGVGGVQGFAKMIAPDRSVIPQENVIDF